jgi:maleylacetate reductase
VSAAFTWHDGERVVHFGLPAAEAGDALRAHGFVPYDLVTTERALATLPEDVRAEASAVHLVAAGPVTETAAALLAEDPGGRLVAWGGGRVIDTAKATAAVGGGAVAAVPTTLAGAEMARGHRMPAGYDDRPRVRPRLVLADPALMTGLPRPRLAESAMNALAHAAEALVTPRANPVCDMAALRAARCLADGLEGGGAAPLALGALLAAYAMDSAGYALHHVLGQTLVRAAGCSHAGAYAALLPHTLAALARRAPAPMDELAAALGTTRDGLGARVAALGGGRRLRDLGVDRGVFDGVVRDALRRRELASTPPPAPDADELHSILAAAW